MTRDRLGAAQHIIMPLCSVYPIILPGKLFRSTSSSHQQLATGSIKSRLTMAARNGREQGKPWRQKAKGEGGVEGRMELGWKTHHDGSTRRYHHSNITLPSTLILTGFGGNVDAPVEVIVDHAVVVVPENECRGFRALHHPAYQFQRRIRCQILHLWSNYFCPGLCNGKATQQGRRWVGWRLRTAQENKF